MSVTQVSPGDHDTLWSALDDATSVLLLAASGSATEAVCSSLLSAVAPDDAQFLSVTLDGSPDDHLDVWRAHVGELPAEAGVIAVGESTRSAAAPTSPSPGQVAVSVDTVSDPSDLTGLAMAVGSYLDAWEAADGTPVVCFDSVSSLLFHVERERAFRFLHATTGRLRDLGAVAHYHLDPAGYDEATVNTFSALFDAVVEVDDGSVTVRRRR